MKIILNKRFWFLLFHRDLDRERTKMENQEKKVIADIKKMAKEGQMVIIYRTFIINQCIVLPPTKFCYK